jgi:hypothetical protein
MIAENFPNLMEERVIEVQETYITPNHQNKKETPPGIL